jgi:hypothetical protein
MNAKGIAAAYLEAWSRKSNGAILIAKPPISTKGLISTMSSLGTFRSLFWAAMVFCGLTLAQPCSATAKQLSDAEIAAELVKPENKAIIEEFLKQELREVNEYATKPLLKNYPSLIFFFKQVDRGPFDSLLFLEAQVHKLRDVQKNIDSILYSVTFSSAEKKKVMGLRTVADKIVSYGIPLMKRDFYRVVQAAKKLADKKRKHPVELIPDPQFRDAIYREVEPTAAGLDDEMGKLSEGESICMRLGWTLEQVTVTRWWLVFNDNTLPKESEYLVFRKKRSEYFQKRLKRIYGNEVTNSGTTNKWKP